MLEMAQRAQRDSRSRNWMGVVYHPNDVTHHPGMGDTSMITAFARIAQLGEFVKHVKYMTHGTETCPTTGTEHLQLFFVFKNDQSLANLRAKFTAFFGFPQTIAWKKADSNADECIEYCQKDGKNIVEFGSRPKGKGARSDLLAVSESIKAGANMCELFELHPSSFLKFAPGMQRAIALQAKPRDWKTEVFWIHGPTGTGKSRWVFQTCDRSELYVKDGHSKWFDGYLGQKNVLFDDFRPCKELPFSTLLRLLDRYPMTVEGKGCSMNFSPERIFITTPLPPKETFQHLDWMKDEELNQLERRITQVIPFPDMNTITHYALLEPFVMIPNDWSRSVGQQTRVKPVAVKTRTPSSSREQSGQTTTPIQSQQVLDLATDYSSDSSAMNSIEEISGDEEPEDGDSIHSSPRSSDSEESDNSFIEKETPKAASKATIKAKRVLHSKQRDMSSQEIDNFYAKQHKRNVQQQQPVKKRKAAPVRKSKTASGSGRGTARSYSSSIMGPYDTSESSDSDY